MRLTSIVPTSGRRDMGGGGAGGSLADRCLDWGEKLLILTLYGWLAARLVADGRESNLILLASEGVVIIFVLVRRSAEAISRRPIEWLISGGATCIPLMASPRGVADRVAPLASWAGLLLLVLGLLVQLHAKLVLGRSFGCVPAHRGLALGGPYRIVRHPMYSGYLMGHVGYLSLHPSAWNATVYLACYACQVPRLLAEERLLSADPAYRAYREEVPSRLIPGVF